MSSRQIRGHGYVVLAACLAIAATWGLARCSDEISPIGADDTGNGNGKPCRNNAQCGQNEICKDSFCLPAGTDQDAAVKVLEGKILVLPAADAVSGNGGEG